MVSRTFQPAYFGKYYLVEKIASGGMAEVFRAVLKGAAGFEKTVALKRILPFFGDDAGFVTLFQDEARIVSTLTHVNIAQVFDFGEVEGSYYLTMELVEGIDLAKLGDRLAEAAQPMPMATAAFVVAEAARGLAYAHEKVGSDGQALGIVHRDVSPQNILISYEGEVKVTDFGIAKAAGKSHKTATGVVMGKLKYMSPEQVSGQPLDPRSDVFSLGVILYELLTGGPVFPGEETVRLAELIHTAAIPPPSRRASGIPPEVDAIALKALARSREERYARAAELARDLTVFVNQHSPGFTREDLAAMVKHVAPRPAASPSPAALAPTEITPPAVDAATTRLRTESAPAEVPPTRRASTPSPDAAGAGTGATSGPRQLDVATRTRFDDEDPRPLTERKIPTEPVRRKKRLSREAWFALVLMAVIVASGAGIVFKLYVFPAEGGRERDASIVLGEGDAGALVEALPDAGAGTLDEARKNELVGQLGRISIIKQPGRPEFQLFLSALDWELSRLVAKNGVVERGKEAQPATLQKRLERHPDIRQAVEATSEYFRGTNELPAQVSMSLNPFLARNPAWASSADGGWSAAALAVIVRGADAESLTALAQANHALSRWCAPAPSVVRRDPVLCEAAALSAALRQSGAAGVADALERWGEAQPDDRPVKVGGGTVKISSRSRDPFLVNLEATVSVEGSVLVEGKAIPLRREELWDAGPSATRLTGDVPADAFAPVLEVRAGGETARIRL